MRGETRTLGQVAEIVMGQSPPGETCNTNGIGLPLLNGPTEFGPRHPLPIQFTTAPKKCARSGDILFCVRGSTTGRMNWADRHYAIGRGVAAIRHRTFPELQPLVRAVIECELPVLLAQATGSTFPNVSAGQLASLSWPDLDLPEQRAIAHILGTLDDKIELNRRMSETLEAIARALFESWFIDFDPVRRNMARKRGQNQPSPPAPLPGGEGRREGDGREGRRLQYRGGYDFAGLVETARELRKKQTSAEAIFWELVRDRRFLNLKFRRQHQIGDYIADFYCHECRLVIEFDGGVHSGKQPKDHKRDAWMAAHGFNVLRFKNEQLLDDPESVLTAIAHAAENPPSPPGRRAGDEGVIEGAAFDHLFPNRLVDSELGEIPEGWRVGRLGDLSFLNPEVWPKERRPSEIKYVDLSNTKWGRIESVITYSSAEAPSRAQRVLRPGDTIVGTVRPGNGSYALISELGLTGTTGFAVLRPKEPIYTEFVYLAATEAENINALAHLADGAAYPAIRPEVVAGTTIIRPNDEVLAQFSRSTGPFLKKIAECEVESRTLAAIRDALLPKLVRGEIRVKDAERFLKERKLC